VIADVCERTPRGVRRLLNRHRDEPGVVVHAWFGMLDALRPTGRSAAIRVYVDREHRASVDPWSHGPRWIALSPGAHFVEFRTAARVLGSEQLVLDGDAVSLLAFKPPNRVGLWRRTQSRWCVRQLR
jgi:hypothetical protein